MKRAKPYLLFLAAGGILLHTPAAATAIGTGTVGPVGSGMGASGYFREWIDLEQRGDLLVGLPKTGPIRMVALHGSGLTAEHLILRWTQRDDNKSSILLAAPDRISAATTRVSLYLGPRSTSVEMYEKMDGSWQLRQPNEVDVTKLHQKQVHSPFLVFVMDGLGPYWLVGDAPSQTAASSEILPSTSPLVEGSITRALANWFWPLALLSGAWAAARFRHKRESADG